MDWTPKEDVLQRVLEVLEDTFVPDSEVQRAVQAKVDALRQQPDFCNYLLLVAESAHSFDDRTRALAALVLKNNIAYYYASIPAVVKQQMQPKYLAMLSDSSREVRLSASVLVNVMVQKEGFACMVNVINYVANLLATAGSEEVCDAAMKTLVVITEDHLNSLPYGSLVDPTIKGLLATFIELTGHKSVAVQRWAFQILNDTLEKHFYLIQGDFDRRAYLEKLISHAIDEHPQIIRAVVQGFVAYVNNQDDTILPAMNDVICYMLTKSVDTNTDVALQACEFWLALSKLHLSVEMLRGHLKTLIPILLVNMRYSDYELLVLKDSLGKDLDMQDSSQDVKPFAKASDDDDDPDIACTLRKCSAASLDALAIIFGEELSDIALPLIMQNLNSEDALLKECGILAFGAIADGCFHAFVKQLPDLLPMFLECMDHPSPLVRSITCWTLSRYTRSIVYDDKLFLVAMKSLLEHSLDENKRVQRAAISSFCFFQEEAKTKLVAYIDVITQAFVLGFDVYKTRSLMLLYDAIGVLAQGVGAHFTSVLGVLMPRLLTRFTTLDDYNNPEEFLAICECLSSVVVAVGEEFAPYAEVVYVKCTGIITENNLGDNSDEEYDKNLVCGAMDLLAALCSSLKEKFATFFVNLNFIDQLYGAIQDKSTYVRQPGLALLGELVHLCFPYIGQHVHVFMPLIIENLDKRFNGACNNAAWVISKLCVAMEAAITPYAGRIIEHVAAILQSNDGMMSVHKTVAITFCTLGLVCPNEVSPYLRSLMRPVCGNIRNVADCEEKAVAFRGLCELIVRNPDVFADDFIYFCDAAASWNDVETELRKRIAYMIMEYKQHVGSNWEEIYGTFPPLLKTRLAVLYGV